MLAVYLIALIVGGGLLVTAISGGHDDAHHDASALSEVGHGDFALGVLGWLPITSLRFWTFFSAFFGLIGTVLTGWGLAGFGITLLTAIAGGYLSGFMMDRSVRYLTQRNSNSTVGAGDLTGADAEVLLPVGSDKMGKVRLQLKGRTIDLLAETDDSATFGIGERVLVLRSRDDGHVLVTRVDKLEKGDS